MSNLQYYYVADDVTGALDSTPGLNYHNDLSTLFNALFNNQGAFRALLDKIQSNLNTDQRLHLLQKFDWARLPSDPASGQRFEEYFFTKSISELIRGLDKLLSHSPYVA